MGLSLDVHYHLPVHWGTRNVLVDEVERLVDVKRRERRGLIHIEIGESLDF